MKFKHEKIFILHLVLVIFIHIAVCQLDFNSYQRSQQLGLLCRLDDLKSTNLTQLNSLVIYRLTTNGSEILASVSAQYDKTDPVSHLPTAQVTGLISVDGSSQRYLQIQWDYPGPELNGDYRCKAYGVDSVYSLVQLSQTLHVQFKTTGPRFTVNPNVIEVGLTQQLEIICSLPNQTALNVTKLAYLKIYKVDNHYGIKQLLTSIKSLSAPILHQGANGGIVNGSIDGSNPFLGITWENPTADHSREYICEGSGINNVGDPVFVNRHIDVSWKDPNITTLVDRLFQMNKNGLESSRLIDQVKSSLTVALDTVNRLNRTLCPKS